MEDFKRMRVAELRAELDEHGVQYKASTRKPELLRLLELAIKAKKRVHALRILDEIEYWFVKMAPPPQPDIIAEGLQDKTEGWTFNVHTKEVKRYWTTHWNHGKVGRVEGWSQGGVDLFRKKEDAHRRMRYEYLRRMIKGLEGLDAP